MGKGEAGEVDDLLLAVVAMAQQKRRPGDLVAGGELLVLGNFGYAQPQRAVGDLVGKLLLDGSLDTTDPTTADFTRTGGEVSFLVVPQQASDVTLDVTAGDISKSFTVGSLKPGLGELKSGMQLRVEITVKEQTIEIGSITIEGWEDQGSIGGEIII